MTATKSVFTTSNPLIDAILSGVQWNTLVLTYSFPTSSSFYSSFYGYGEPGSNFEALNAAQMNAARAAMAAVRTWQFEPARLNGQPVPVVVELVQEFRLH